VLLLFAFPVYVVLQFYCVRQCENGWSAAAWLPVPALLISIGLVALSVVNFLAIPWFYIIYTTPVSIVWLLAVMLFRSLSMRREQRAYANSEEGRWQALRDAHDRT
jgi:small-conductance mechanosensitive channel